MDEINEQNVRFKNITLMSSVESILFSDRFLIARKDSSTLGYTTYLTTWNAISADLVAKAKDYTTKIGVLTSINALNENAKTSSIAGNVGYEIMSRLSAVQQNAVCKSLLPASSVLTISANTYLKNASCDYYPTIESNENKVCNLSTMYHHAHLLVQETPLVSNAFYGVAMNGKTFTLSDILPFGYKHNKFTIVCKFRRTSATISGTKNLSFGITTDLRNATIRKVRSYGEQALTSKSDTYYYAMYVVDLSKSPPDQNNLPLLQMIKLSINNGNFNGIDVYLSIFEGELSHLSSYL